MVHPVIPTLNGKSQKNEPTNEMIELSASYKSDIVALSADTPQPYISQIKVFDLKSMLLGESPSRKMDRT